MNEKCCRYQTQNRRRRHIWKVWQSEIGMGKETKAKKKRKRKRITGKLNENHTWLRTKKCGWTIGDMTDETTVEWGCVCLIEKKVRRKIGKKRKINELCFSDQSRHRFDWSFVVDHGLLKIETKNWLLGNNLVALESKDCEKFHSLR